MIRSIGIVFLMSVTLCFSACLAPRSATAGANTELDAFQTDRLKIYDGRILTQVRIQGLVRTHEQAILWLLGVHVGEVFDADKWIDGIHRIYNTTDLYDVESIPIAGKDLQSMEIEIRLKDKWTLFPYAQAQGGGGWVSAQVGLYDSNLGGYFTYASVDWSTLNGTMGFDLNLFQEWFLGSDYYFGLDYSKNGYPTSVYDAGGNSSGDFTYFRLQEQVLLGKRIGKGIRALIYLEHFTDTLNSGAPALNNFLTPGDLYRARPQVIFGRSQLTNFLEEGQEVTVGGTVSTYDSLLLSFKRVWVTGGNSNVAVFAALNVSSPTQFVNLPRLGGYDTVRGYATDRIRGQYTANTSFEYRPKLWSDRFNFFDLDLVVVQAALFADAGGAYDPARSLGLGLVSTGAGLRFNFVRFAGAILRFDVARTLAPFEGGDLSFGVGQFF